MEKGFYSQKQQTAFWLNANSPHMGKQVANAGNCWGKAWHI